MLNITIVPQGKLNECLKDTVDSIKGDVYVIVPKYLTLQTEMLLTGETGSFRINVCSTEKLASRIFETAGKPDWVRVDDKGRVMLLRRAVTECADELTVYKDMRDKRGFPLRAAKQIELFRQSALSSNDIMALSDNETGLAKRKLNDISRIMARYEELIAGRFTDGEGEMLYAAEKAGDSSIVKEAGGMIFYGFDIIPISLMRLIASLAKKCPVTSIFAADLSDGAGSFEPIAKAIGRLRYECNKMGVETITRDDARPVFGDESIEYLYRGLYSQAKKQFSGDGRVHVYEAKNPKDESLYVASKCRELTMRGARYNEMLVICRDQESYSLSLKKAFDLNDIPVFMSSSRSAARYGLCEAVFAALRLIKNNFETEDALALMRSGMIECENMDEFAAYCARFSPRGSRLKADFTYGTGIDLVRANIARQAIIEPVLTLKDRLSSSKTLGDQLTAIYNYIEDIGAYDKCLARRREFEGKNDYQLAGEISQTFNRLIDALDQMALLSGDRMMSITELNDTLNEALSAAIIKPLPQSGDAVYVQSIDEAITQDVKYLFFTGMNDITTGGSDYLLSDEMLSRIAGRENIYLGEDADSRAKLTRARIKAAIANASEGVYFSYALMGVDSSAQSPSATIGEIKRIFPELIVETEFKANSYKAAIEEMTGKPDVGLLTALRNNGISEAARLISSRGRVKEDLSPDIAKKAYEKFDKASITRLEMFAECPFAHFVKYTLKPDIDRPYVLDPMTEGNIMHAAMEDLAKDAKVHGFANAEARMDEITDRLIKTCEEEHLFTGSVDLSDKLRLKRAARTAAAALAYHFSDGEFRPKNFEVEFGARGTTTLTLHGETGDTRLNGKIDRIDVTDDGEFLRIIDYKRGANEIELDKVYFGLQLQLILYLAVAMLGNKDAKAAGVYYFRVKEDIIGSTSLDEEEIEREHREDTRMEGLTLNDADALDALGKEPGMMVKVSIKKDGTPSEKSHVIDEDMLSLLCDHVIKTATAFADQIRHGSAKIAPAGSSDKMPCSYCEYRNACLFDDNMDRNRRRICRKMDKKAVIEALKKEYGMVE